MPGALLGFVCLAIFITDWLVKRNRKNDYLDEINEIDDDFERHIPNFIKSRYLENENCVELYGSGYIFEKINIKTRKNNNSFENKMPYNFLEDEEIMIIFKNVSNNKVKKLYINDYINRYCLDNYTNHIIDLQSLRNLKEGEMIRETLPFMKIFVNNSDEKFNDLLENIKYQSLELEKDKIRKSILLAEEKKRIKKEIQDDLLEEGLINRGRRRNNF